MRPDEQKENLDFASFEFRIHFLQSFSLFSCISLLSFVARTDGVWIQVYWKTKFYENNPIEGHEMEKARQIKTQGQKDENENNKYEHMIRFLGT